MYSICKHYHFIRTKWLVRWKANSTWTPASVPGRVSFCLMLNCSLTFHTHTLKTAVKVRTLSTSWLAQHGELVTVLFERLLWICVFGGWVLCSCLLAQYSHESRWQPAQFSNAENIEFNRADHSQNLASGKILGQNPVMAKFTSTFESPKFRLPSRYPIWSTMLSSDWAVDKA